MTEFEDRDSADDRARDARHARGAQQESGDFGNRSSDPVPGSVANSQSSPHNRSSVGDDLGMWENLDDDDSWPDDDPTWTTEDLPPQRTWVHPSEMGHTKRVAHDQKRSRRVLIGVMAVAVGALGASFVVTRTAGTSSTGDVATATSPQPHTVLVESVNGETTDAGTAIVMDDDGHILTTATEVDGLSKVRVLCGDRYRSARVIAQDDEMNLAVMRLDDPFGKPPTMAKARPGDQVNVVAMVSGGGREMRQSTVSDIEGEMEGPSGSKMDGLVQISEPGLAKGVVSSTSGHVVAIMLVEEDGMGMALPIEAAMDRAKSLVHP